MRLFHLAHNHADRLGFRTLMGLVDKVKRTGFCRDYLAVP